jgi:hypothetical protein
LDEISEAKPSRLTVRHSLVSTNGKRMLTPDRDLEN